MVLSKVCSCSTGLFQELVCCLKTKQTKHKFPALAMETSLNSTLKSSIPTLPDLGLADTAMTLAQLLGVPFGSESGMQLLTSNESTPTSSWPGNQRIVTAEEALP